MKEDRFTTTEHDAGLYEARRGRADDLDERPTLLEAERDEYDDLIYDLQDDDLVYDLDDDDEPVRAVEDADSGGLL